MRYAFILALLLMPSVLATVTSFTVTTNSSFMVANKNYTITLFNENASIISDGTSTSILPIHRCLEQLYSKVCLVTASNVSATLTTEFLGPVLKYSMDIAPTTVSYGTDVNLSLVLSNTGSQQARDVHLQLNIPEGVLFDTNKAGQYLWDGPVYQDTPIRLTLSAQRNGTYSVNGTVTYFDGNTTQTLSITTKSFTVTTPLKYVVTYNQTPNSDNNTVTLNASMTDSNNWSVLLRIDFPPEITILGATKYASIEKQTVTFRQSTNSTQTKANLEAYYEFTSQPSEPFTVNITYKNDTETHTIGRAYDFAAVQDSDPSLAAQVGPLVENDASDSLDIIITGNRTGVLTLFGAINQTQTAGPGNLSYDLSGLIAGNYSVNISYTTTNVFGKTSVASGVVNFTVSEPPRNPEPVAPALNDTIQNSTEIPVAQTVQGSGLAIYIWIAGLASLCALIALLLVLRKFKDPLHRLEVLIGNLTEAAELLEQKRKTQGLTKEETRELADIQKELQELEERL